jgi:mono/diheme cytochrome c family protein
VSTPENKVRIEHVVVAALLGLAMIGPAKAGDVDRGEVLYKARCVGCHDTSVHRREARKALTIEGIKAQVKRWDSFTGGAWGDTEINDVTTYLNDLYYNYPCSPAVCPEKKAGLELVISGPAKVD